MKVTYQGKSPGLEKRETWATRQQESNLDKAFDEIVYFFGGAFQGTWSQAAMNGYESKQFWQQQTLYDDNDSYTDWQLQQSRLWDFLPQQQNPISQSAIWESQYIKDLPQTWANITTTNPYTGQTTTTSKPVYIAGPGLPEPTTFTLAKAPSLNGCLAQYSKGVDACRAVYPEGSPQLLSCVQAAQQRANGGCPGLKPFP